jgi:predicted membrane chloride channel (bestrophin family)
LQGIKIADSRFAGDPFDRRSADLRDGRLRPGSVLKSIISQLVFMAAISSLTVLTQGQIFGETIPLDTAPFTLFGLALAIVLAFRNNASYGRFNEARHL